MPTKSTQTTSKIIIPYGRQQISQADIDAVVKVLESDFLTQGPLVENFEKALSSYCGARYAVVFSSGTAALHAAATAAGISKGDEVITSPISFVATSNCVLFNQGKPVFADVDPHTIQITAETVAPLITRKTKAIIPVDFAGRAHGRSELAKLANDHDLIVIEDAAHSLGATYMTRRGNTEISTRVGSCADADMTCFSFHPVKSITTAEGGAVTTNSEEFYHALIKFRQHGITKQAMDFVDGGMATCSWYYEMQQLGYNYRLSDIQCALGISQLATLGHKINRRREIEGFYRQQLSELHFLKADDANSLSAHHIVPVLIDPSMRNHVFEAMRRIGIGVQLHYIPIYRQPYYKKIFGEPVLKKYPNAEKYFASTLSLPIFPDLSESDQIKVIDSFRMLIDSQADKDLRRDSTEASL